MCGARAACAPLRPQLSPGKASEYAVDTVEELEAWKAALVANGVTVVEGAAGVDDSAPPPPTEAGSSDSPSVAPRVEAEAPEPAAPQTAAAAAPTPPAQPSTEELLSRYSDPTPEDLSRVRPRPPPRAPARSAEPLVRWRLPRAAVRRDGREPGRLRECVAVVRCHAPEVHQVLPGRRCVCRLCTPLREPVGVCAAPPDRAVKLNGDLGMQLKLYQLIDESGNGQVRLSAFALRAGLTC